MTYQTLMTADEIVRRAIDVAKNYKTIYMYAAYGFQVTDGTIEGKAKQNCNGWYTSSRIATLKKVANQNPPTWGFDCVNLYKAIFWGWVGDASKVKGGAKYGTNTVPDTNANGMFDRCTDKSTNFSNIVPGEAVWISGHFGMYVGNGLVVECTPRWKNGVQITYLANIGKVSGYNGRKWTKHGKLPWIDYSSESKTDGKTSSSTLGSRWLKKGSEGQDVKDLQEALMKLGYDLHNYGADGEFGKETYNALLEFQAAECIEVDGIYGDESHKALMGALDQLEGAGETEPEKITTKTVVVTGGSVNVRKGPSTEYGIITVVHKGDKLQSSATAENGWHCVQINGEAGWISGKYVE